jgi:hypothetical protein
MAYRSTKLQQEQTNFMDASTGDLRANGLKSAAANNLRLHTSGSQPSAAFEWLCRVQIGSELYTKTKLVEK